MLVSKGYPDIGWNPVEGERYLDFLRFAVFCNGRTDCLGSFWSSLKLHKNRYIKNGISQHFHEVNISKEIEYLIISTFFYSNNLTSDMCFSSDALPLLLN